MSIMTQMAEESHEWRCRAEKAEAEVNRLRRVLAKYKHCRHACAECFCTVDAVAALERKP